MEFLGSAIVGWVAVATGIGGLVAVVFLALFFTVGQPFGTINDVCNGLTALLCGALAVALRPQYAAHALVPSWVFLVLAVAGALIAAAGSVLVIFRITGWFLAGIVGTVGYALIGLWLLGLSSSAQAAGWLPPGLAISGMVLGVIVALGFAAVPGVLRGIDAREDSPWYVLAGLAAGSLGWLVLNPIWCIWLGLVVLRW
jgi:hypothetical protein